MAEYSEEAEAVRFVLSLLEEDLEAHKIREEAAYEECDAETMLERHEAVEIRESGIREIKAALESPEEPTVRNIVACWLKAHGYSALCGDECGCSIEDLFPCDGEWPPALDCRAGYWRKGTEMECYEVNQEPGSYIASLDKEAPDAEAV